MSTELLRLASALISLAVTVFLSVVLFVAIWRNEWAYATFLLLVIYIRGEWAKR